MYLVHNSKSNQDKIFASIITSVFLLGCYFMLQTTELPEVKLKTESYDEINWTKFRPKLEKIADRPRPNKLRQPLTMKRPQVPQPAKVEKVDLSSLKNMRLQSLATISQTLQDPQKRISASKSRLKLDLSESTVLAGLNSLSGESTQRLTLKRGRRGGSDRGSELLLAQSGSTLDFGNGSHYGSGRPSLGAPRSKSINRGVAQVELLDTLELGADYSDLSPVFHALIAWMKRNPAEFPEIVKRFMQEAPEDLTSMVSFQIGGRRFQMFLMCKQKLFEVRVCLLEGNESTYLIDRGFKEKSSYLRVGSVNRSGDGKILSFGTARRAASDVRTKQFYQIFLSWWDTVK